MLTKVNRCLDVLRRSSIDDVRRIALPAAWVLWIRETSLVRELIAHHRDGIRSMEFHRLPALHDIGALVLIVVWLALVADTTGWFWLDEPARNCLIQARPLAV